ncbi:DUF4148 domain-containing protein [Caballeronia novacaledonica]|uniref:DUF4148 domain-containing protein n=1 Tax=Caballeronia novacaledonica TaxID=1544861 RepID=UPI00285281B7|nr:DUF4148 domain-containing protein [Caballeronia novacaledonica]
MHRLMLPAFVVALACSASISALAQSDARLTRAQVRAQLVELQRAGWDPRWDNWTYPAGLQRAQARVDARRDAVAGVSQPSSSNDSAAGSR